MFFPGSDRNKNLHQSSNNKVLGLFSLIMISVIAVDSLRTLSAGAEYGFSLLFFYIVIALVFFIPNILISAELASGWPSTGGAYIWIREAFGKKWGFFAIWLQWVYNLAWFPVIFAFISATLAALIDPYLAHSKFYMLTAILVLLWLSTLAGCSGMKTAGGISAIGALAGTLFPMLAIILLGAVWIISGRPVQIDFSVKCFFPDLRNINSLALLSTLLFGLLGIEISAVHAGNVQDPQKNYPKSLAYAGIIIFFSLVLASLAISIVVPPKQITLVSGLINAFSLFFNAFHLPWATDVIAVLIIIGSLAGVSAWILGPVRSLLIACQDAGFKSFLQKTNKNGIPAGILLLQGVIVSVLCTVFLLMPSVNGSYWVLSDLTVELALPYYILMFAAGIRLRYKKADVIRSYRVPGGNFGIWLCGSAGILACLFAIVIGFLPPSQVQVGKVWIYESILIGGIFIFGILPFMICALRRPLSAG